MIGKLTIDKSSMNISYFLYTIKIIASHEGKISRKNFVKEMADFVGVPAVQNNKENRTAYNKSKLPRYFGFVDIVADEQDQNYLVLTHRGEILAEYIVDNGADKDAAERYSIASEHRTDFIDLIFDSVIFDSFGKNNSGAEQSNTDVEPPKVVFKTIYELGKATAEEICYIMFGLNRGVFSDFDEAIASVRENRSNAIYDYSQTMEEWAITNIVHDCKIINIFTDNNISLLVSERDADNGKLYYQLSSILSESHREQLRTISAVYEPLKLFAYTNGNEATVENWVEGAVLGRISDNLQIVHYEFGSDSEIFCADDSGSNYVPGVFENAILTAFQNEKKNIYFVVKNTTEASFFAAIGKYAKLLKRLEDVKDDWHGWSKTPLKDDKLYHWLITQSDRARSILRNNEVILPSNLHIVGTVIMDDENKNTEFDYEFRRCLIDTSGNKMEGNVLTTDLTPEWFKEKAKDFKDYDEKAIELRKAFLLKYNIEYLTSLSGKDVLTSIFLNGENKSNLCYELEFSAEMREFFGSIKGGTAYKYGLHYSQKHNSWVTGSFQKPILLNDEAAIELGTKIRDYLVDGAKVIEQVQGLSSLEDYLNLFETLNNVTDGYINKIWFIKYYQMIRPDLLPPIYSDNAQRTVLNAIKELSHDNVLCRMGQICFYVNQCDISNVMFNKVFWTYAVSIIKDETVGDLDMAEEAKTVYLYDTTVKSGIINLIVYGTPGCGKSFHVKNKLLKDYKEANVIRTTFYQDYTNTDFVGQLMPYVSGEKVTYKFNPGPFTLALQQAIQCPNEQVALVIEELNRGNAPSIFGDIFQLLDRKDGRSEYKITNVNVQKYLNDEFPEYIFENIMIPANLSIIATMNTSDQNVFTLDTAFKRRWEFLKLKNVFVTIGEDKHPYSDYFVPGTNGMTWQNFVDEVNAFIVNKPSDLQSEDKQLGVFFVTEGMLCKNVEDTDDKKAERFAYKVLEYLWDDVAKFDRDTWFKSNIKSLDDLVDGYVKSGVEVFKDGIFRKQN